MCVSLFEDRQVWLSDNKSIRHAIMYVCGYICVCMNASMHAHDIILSKHSMTEICE